MSLWLFLLPPEGNNGSESPTWNYSKLHGSHDSLCFWSLSSHSPLIYSPLLPLSQLCECHSFPMTQTSFVIRLEVTAILYYQCLFVCVCLSVPLSSQRQLQWITRATKINMAGVESEQCHIWAEHYWPVPTDTAGGWMVGPDITKETFCCLEFRE